MHGRVISVGLAILVAFAVFPRAATRGEQPPPAPGASVDMEWGVSIPMRDGVALNATIYRPHGQKEPLPAIFTLTPYIGDSYLDRALYFAEHGYVFALVDVRGRGNSGGTFEPFASDAKDGHDIVEWLAARPWCNRKVAMWGGSYAGFDQWATVKELPPHLSTIVPAAAAHPGVDFPFQYDIFTPYDMQWLSFTSGVTGNGNLFGTAAFWGSKARAYYDAHSAFQDYDRLVGNPSGVFQKWLQHPTPDDYYDAMVPAPAQYERIRIPILTITGHYDGDQPGAFTYYNRHMQFGSPEAKANHYLIVGPWDHAGTRTPKAEVGGLKFGAASVLDLNKLHREWYDWAMKSGAKPAFLKNRVAYYVVGADEWKYADSLEGIAGEKRALFLASRDGAGDVFHSGSLSEKPVAGAASDRWTYDPLDTRPGDGEPDEDPAYLVSERPPMNLFGNGAVYHGEPFAEPTEITGFPRLTLWLSMDVPDTDLEALLYEILPNGGSVLLTGATMRARHRESLRKEKPVPSGKAEKYVFDNFTFFSRRVARGSRLRLLVHCLNTIGTEKNYNSGGVVAAETGRDARTAHVTLLHDAAHPSALELPVVRP
jgi:putative CocE/NonD family hydrolase